MSDLAYPPLTYEKKKFSSDCFDLMLYILSMNCDEIIVGL